MSSRNIFSHRKAESYNKADDESSKKKNYIKNLILHTIENDFKLKT